MYEILLEKAVNTLSSCEDYLTKELDKQHTPEEFKQINELLHEIQKVIKQADSLNL